MAVAQVMGGQRTARNMIGLGADSAELGVSATVEMPVAFKLGATGTVGKLLIDVLPSHITMLLHVIVGDLIRDPLVAES